MKITLLALLATLAVPALLSAPPALAQKPEAPAAAVAPAPAAEPPYVPKEPPPAELLKKADAGDAAAMRDIGLFYYNKTPDSDWVAAHQWFVKAAMKGDADGEYYTGRDFWLSHGVGRETTASLSFLSKAAAAGNAKAQAMLGQILLEGEDENKTVNIVQPDPESAAKLLKLGADQGNPDAEYQLGLAYMSTDVHGASPQAALATFEKSAVHGSVLAQRKLGQLYYAGNDGVAEDVVKSRTYFEQAAAQGDAVSQYFLGRFYDLGLGVEKDGAKAAEWFRKVDGNSDLVDEHDETLVDLLMGAQLRLGVLYRDGTGVKKDLDEAARWFARAARGGSPGGQLHLGEAYEVGEGVALDKNQAYVWFGVAASGYGSPFPPDSVENIGTAAKDGMARLEKGMTPTELATAKQALADEMRALEQIASAYQWPGNGYWRMQPP